jgi:mannose-6-phosphate isomerase
VKAPFQLLPLLRERVWGRKGLAPYFAQWQDRPIGELWFTFEENVTSSGKTLGELLEVHPGILGTGADPRYPGICPLLVKLLFTMERLSVQVHPDDEYAGLHHNSLGKTAASWGSDSGGC